MLIERMEAEQFKVRVMEIEKSKDKFKNKIFLIAIIQHFYGFLYFHFLFINLVEAISAHFLK